MVVVTGFVLLVILATVDTIQQSQVFIIIIFSILLQVCLSIGMDPAQVVFLFVYTKHNPTENVPLLWLGVFFIHEVCIFCLLLPDIIN